MVIDMRYFRVALLAFGAMFVLLGVLFFGSGVAVAGDSYAWGVGGLAPSPVREPSPSFPPIGIDYNALDKTRYCIYGGIPYSKGARIKLEDSTVVECRLRLMTEINVEWSAPK